MEKNALIFTISGENYRKVIQYRQATDHHIIQSQIKNKGHALITNLYGVHAFTTINEVPEVGAAVPWYGTLGGGYRYTFTLRTEGGQLALDNIASENALICPEILPSLELTLAAGFFKQDTLEKPEPTNLFAIFNHWNLVDEHAAQEEMIFRITPDIYPRLINWTHWGKDINGYKFLFTPLSVGVEVIVHQEANGEEINLTADENW